MVCVLCFVLIKDYFHVTENNAIQINLLIQETGIETETSVCVQSYLSSNGTA